MILFQANVAVPKHIIDQIGQNIKSKLVHELALKLDEFQMSEIDLMNVENTLNGVIWAVANAENKTCEGWSLSKEQANDIAHQLRQDRKIMAIKRFREATGAGLADSKYFIDKFGLGEVAAIEFLTVFV